MEGGGDNRSAEVINAKSAKFSAWTMFPLFSQLVAQLKPRHHQAPMLSDLRESGSDRQDEFSSYALSRGYYNPNSPDRGNIGSDLIAKKHRNGPAGLLSYCSISIWPNLLNLIFEIIKNELMPSY